MDVVVWGLLKEMAKDGLIKVSVITTSIKDKPEKFIEENVSVVAIAGVKSRRYTPKWWKLSVNYFEIYFLNDTTYVMGVAMSACGLLFGHERLNMPLLWQVHGMAVGEVISKIRMRHLIQL